MRIIFLGTPKFAQIILDILAASPYRPNLVITETDKPVGRKQILTPSRVKYRAKELGIKVLEPINHSELVEAFRREKPDLAILAAYGRILKKEVLDIPRLGILNAHASLLPKYRGASPIQTAILTGENNTGVTIMKIDEGLDTGKILSWTETKIEPDDTAESLGEKLAEIGGALLVETISTYITGNLQLMPQEEKEATLTDLISKDDGRLTGQENPELITRMIRAYTPWPGVWAEIDGIRLLILAAHTKNNVLEIDKIQVAGKKPVSWQIFIEGYPELSKKLLTLLARSL